MTSVALRYITGKFHQGWRGSTEEWRRITCCQLLTTPGVIEEVESGHSPREDDIIHLVAKEGELKVEARAFAAPLTISGSM